MYPPVADIYISWYRYHVLQPCLHPSSIVGGAWTLSSNDQVAHGQNEFILGLPWSVCCDLLWPILTMLRTSVPYLWPDMARHSQMRPRMATCVYILYAWRAHLCLICGDVSQKWPKSMFIFSIKSVLKAVYPSRGHNMPSYYVGKHLHHQLAPADDLRGY